MTFPPYKFEVLNISGLPMGYIGLATRLERTQDAMTYVRCHGRPDLFITFTCDPKWPEIDTQLMPGQKSQDLHDLLARVLRIRIRIRIRIPLFQEIRPKSKK